MERGQAMEDAAEIIVRALTLADDLHARTNAALRLTRPAPIALVVILLGERARRLLRASRRLVHQGLDDSVGVLARSLLEGALETEYATTETSRRVKGRTVTLDVPYKAALFLTHRDIADARLRAARDVQPPTELAHARELREVRGLSTTSAYWHCANAWKLCEELKGRPDRSSARLLDMIYATFGHLSSYAHPHPHDSAYFEIADVPAEALLSDGFSDVTLPLVAAIAALDSFATWGDHLAHDLRGPALGLMHEASQVLASVEGRASFRPSIPKS